MTTILRNDLVLEGEAEAAFLELEAGGRRAFMHGTMLLRARAAIAASPAVAARIADVLPAREAQTVIASISASSAGAQPAGGVN